jgi:hypothetical protein
MEVVRKYSSLEIKVTVSAENVENVVNPPKNPVAIARRAVSEKKRWFLVSAINSPIINPPMIFAANVPRGMDGKIGLNMIPRPHRKRAPRDAPTQIEKIFVMYMKPILRNFFNEYKNNGW